jgi:HK97 gp10 family phage protein
MSDEVTLSVEGIKELQADLNNLVKQMSSEQVEDALLVGAMTLQQAVKQAAPVGPSGNLKSHIQVKQLPKLGDNPKSAIVKSTAKHDHLVEFGHINWRGGVRKEGEGHQIGGGDKGTKLFTPAHPFFRPAIDVNKEGVLRQIVEDLGKTIDEVLK